MSEDIAAFLAARYDEAEARVYREGTPPNGVIAWLTYLEPDGSMGYTTVAHGDAEDGPWIADGRELAPPASVLVVHDPKHRLADIALKRAILALHRLTVTKAETYRFDSHTGEPIPERYDGDCEICGWFDPEQGGCATVRQLGTEFDGHADYKAEKWKP